MIKNPLVAIALIFCLGILVASKINTFLPLVYFLLILFLILSVQALKKHRIFNIFIFCFFFFLGVVSLKNSQNMPSCHISKFLEYKNREPYIVKGFINSKPILKDNTASFIFNTQTIQSGSFNYTCCGIILVRAKIQKNLHYGQSLILEGNLYRPFSRFNSSMQGYRDYLGNQDIRLLMNVSSEANIVRLNKDEGFMLKRFALRLEAKMEGIISQHTSSLTAAILDAMVLGEKKNIPRFLNYAMMKSGTVHILVVSGFNVGIVSFVIILLLKLIRLPRRLRFCVAIPCLVIYCLMTGSSNPVVRATVMAIVFMAGFLLKREPDIYNSLSVAGLFILLQNPRQLFDIGFQLSFVSVISIVYIYPRIKSLLPIKCFKIQCVKFLLDGFLVSFSAWLGTMGFIAHYFKMFSPITVLANILIVPLATLITLCGFSLIFISLINSSLAPFFASTSDLLVVLLLKINAFLINLPAAYFNIP